MATGKYGPQVMTVQEATNSIAQRRVIRVFPELAATAVSGHAQDVMCTNVEIPNAVIRPGGCSNLLNVYHMDYEDIQSEEDFYVIFHQDNPAAWGTLDATANISADNLKLSKVLGWRNMDNSAGETASAIDNAHLIELQGANGVNEQPLPIFLQAEEDSTSVYFTVIAKDTSGATPDWDTGDWEFIFHIEY